MILLNNLKYQNNEKFNWKIESQLATLSDEQLVARFNREVGNRGLDYSFVKNESGGFNLNAKVILREGKLIF